MTQTRTPEARPVGGSRMGRKRGRPAAPRRRSVLDGAQAALAANNDGGPPAAIGTVAIAKGKDYQYQGAVDALRINGEVFDFEPFGVNVTAP